ncbi:hypothetical protein AGLY_011154 [Aphis glycines]|uniref:Ectonucleoside triphosphate diphosphohydrolase 5 n=1 Tax=Aphis glycines TaxID=307491 RepID=A0A6G0TD20_APHGL|nr:hypothetical protein AGLY_011154 [Aphis glycines]
MNTNQKCGITPLLLRATAGLRLLNDKSDEIINQVKRIFSEYNDKFKVDENSVAIMNGNDEGYYAWFTINYLFDNKMSFKDTVAVFDLGGGSLQITFYLPNSEKNITIDPKYIQLYTVMGEERKFYSYSYLGFGLMEVRTKIFKPKNNDILNVTSPCHNTNDVLKYTFSSKMYYITGSPSDEVKENYIACQEAIKSIVEKTVGNLKNMTSLKYVIAISFFYDLGLDAKLIPTNGGNILIKKLDEAALNCFHNKFDKDQPFKCFDLTYIYVLLHHGFGFSPDSIIAFKKSIDNFELSWVLGFAYVHLQN